MSLAGWTVEKALQTGITMEEGAYQLYTNAQKLVKDPGSKQMLKELASDELTHKEYFVKALRDPIKVMNKINQDDVKKTVKDLGVTDPLKDESLNSDATYQEVLLFAIKSEKKANEFYKALSLVFIGNPIATIWDSFALQEAGHKLRLEREYDDVIFRDN